MTLKYPGPRTLGVPNRILRDTQAEIFKPHKTGMNWIRTRIQSTKF